MMGTRLSIVTGASGGLGRCIASDLSRKGYTVAICSRNSEELSRVCTQIRQEGGVCLSRALDIRDRAQVNDFVNKLLGEFNRIDAFVNSVGFVHPRVDLENIRYQDMLECFETNVFGVFNFLERIVPVMKAQNEGVIVNIASKSGRLAVPGLAAYSASKSAGITMIQTLAKEVAATNILCVTVSPGGMNTAMRAYVYGEEDAKKQQSPDLVATVVAEIVARERRVPQGADILVARGKVTINEMPDLP